MSGSLSEVAAALTGNLSRTNVSSSDIKDLENALDAFVSKHSRADDNSFPKMQEELKKLHKLLLAKTPEKLGHFMTVLKAMRPLMTNLDDLSGWIDAVLISFVDRPDQTRTSILDAQDFVVHALLYCADHATKDKPDRCTLQLRKLVQAHIRRTDILIAGEVAMPRRTAAAGLQQLQGILSAFGRKRPLDLFLQLDRFVLMPATRMQALQILCAWLHQQQPHLDLVTQTPLVDTLLKSFLNDRATVVVNLALQAIVMLVPHIAAHLAKHLPRLFLIYSRCLLWEKYDNLSVVGKTVINNSVLSTDPSEEKYAYYSIDVEWQGLHEVPLKTKALAPDLRFFFTYLYGLYPLNFMSFVRAPRQYLQQAAIPGADDYNLDPHKIKARTEQFQRVHLLHPSFFITTAEEELTQNRWVTSEPSEVIAECIGLYIAEQPVPQVPKVAPSGNLQLIPELQPATTEDTAPAAPLLTSLDLFQARTQDSGTGTPDSISSGSSLRLVVEDMPPLVSASATAVSAVSSAPESSYSSTPSTTGRLYASEDVSNLQQELYSMRSAYNFERYLKQQHVITIGQLKRDRIRQVIQEAETDRLVHSTRSLRKELDAATKFNESLQKEAQNRKTHVSRSEEQLMNKIRTLRETLKSHKALEDDHRRVSREITELRELLVDCERRELRLMLELERMSNTADAVTPVSPSAALQASEIEGYRGPIHIPGSFSVSAVKPTDKEKDSIRQEYQAKLAELEERLAVAEKARAESAQETAILQQRLLEAHDKKVSIERAWTNATERLNSLQVNNDDLRSSVVGGSYKDTRGAGDGKGLWQAPGAAEHSHVRRTSISNDDHQPGFLLANGHSLPTNRPLRLEALGQRADRLNPPSRSEDTSPKFAGRSGMTPEAQNGPDRA